MNRAARRERRARLRASAGATAGFLATGFRHRAEDTGVVTPVVLPKAVAALERAMELMLRAGAKPVVLDLPRDVAAAFPGFHAPEGAAIALAVGVDVEMHASYALQFCASTDRVAAREGARRLALAKLAALTAVAGL